MRQIDGSLYNDLLNCTRVLVQVRTEIIKLLNSWNVNKDLVPGKIIFLYTENGLKNQTNKSKVN